MAICDQCRDIRLGGISNNTLDEEFDQLINVMTTYPTVAYMSWGVLIENSRKVGVCPSCLDYLEESRIELERIIKEFVEQEKAPAPPLNQEIVQKYERKAAVSKDREPSKDTMSFAGYDWLVLEEQGDKVLLLSEKIIDARTFHTSALNTTWAECELRRYLNGAFYDSLGPEKSRIVETSVKNDDNLWFETEGGSDTADKIFLLSIEETDRYFGNSGDYLAKRSKDADENGDFVPDDEGAILSNDYDLDRIAYDARGEASWWWLRSPGIFEGTAAAVTYFGIIFVGGGYADDVVGGIRPALWLDRTSTALNDF
jgi:hypothetical protein